MMKTIIKRIIAAIISATMIAGIAISGAFSTSIQAEAAKGETNMVIALRSAFDPEFYANQYPDVKAAFGTDKTALFNHFMKYGMKEGRMMNANFDPMAYTSAYPDIKAICAKDDYTKAYEHYVTFGKKEGRTLTTNTAINKKKAAEAPKLYESPSKTTTYQVSLGHNLTVNISENMYQNSSFRIMKDDRGYAAYYGYDLYDTSGGYNGNGAYHYSTITVNNGNISETIYSHNQPQQVQPTSQPTPQPAPQPTPQQDDDDDIELTDEEAEALAYLLLLAGLESELEEDENTQE